LDFLGEETLFWRLSVAFCAVELVARAIVAREAAFVAVFILVRLIVTKAAVFHTS